MVVDKEYPEIMTIEQATQYLQVSIRTIYRLIDSGDLKASKVGRVWRIRKIDIDDYLESTSKK
ncbi:MAG: helix-turn-helix domain-containing protein [Ruminiclostridium sp.]|nr:helix-turn-helix domain-containing protein [Ruminiclostridium sp.]